MNRTTAAAVALFALAAGTTLLVAGPLNPPAGPVTSTYKTLSEVEPRIAINAVNTPGDADSVFRITQPGSYYLTGNVTGVVGKHGIEIMASGVTIDLNGFDLVGVAGMGAFDGVRTPLVSYTDISVLNGSVRNWGGEGVGLDVALNSRIIDVRTSGNAGIGILVGNNSIVTGCLAYNNAGSGIVAGVGSTITTCSAFDNGGDGFATTPGCTITACISYSNGSDGFDVGPGSTVSHCNARLNFGNGIRVLSATYVLSNTCSFNGGGGGDGAGIYVTGGDNRIEGNQCIGADRGIDVDSAGNIIIRNTCAANSTNWDIVAGNHYGPIIDRTAVAPPPAVSGNAATEALGSTHPNANFTY